MAKSVDTEACANPEYANDGIPTAGEPRHLLSRRFERMDRRGVECGVGSFQRVERCQRVWTRITDGLRRHRTAFLRALATPESDTDTETEK